MVKSKPTVEEALNKIYLVKRNGIHIPNCLIGKRVKLVLSSEMEDNGDKWAKKVDELYKEIDSLRAENKLLMEILDKAKKNTEKDKLEEKKQ